MLAQRTSPELSVLLVIGDRRERAQRVLDAVDAQTRADALELIVVDLGAAGMPPLRRPKRVPLMHVPLPRTTAWGSARAAALRHAQADLVAYIEDHCYPAPGWAAALLDAHQGPWAAIGYAFTNPNPDNYIARAAFLADYGRWAHPARTGPARLLSYNNVSYKRSALALLGERLEGRLGSDFHVFQEFSRAGLRLYVEGRAVAAHESFTHLGDLLQANHSYSRLLAADRVRNGDWSRARRLLWGAATPVGAPLISLGRTLRSLSGHPSLWGSTAAAMPVLLACAAWTAIGESLGYLLGAGSSPDDLKHWEIHSNRRLGGRAR